MSEQDGKWIKDNIVSVLSITITILTIGYFGIIKGNDEANQIKAHDKTIVEMKESIKALEENKVNKEVFMMIQTTMVGMAIDIKEIRTMQFKQKGGY